MAKGYCIAPTIAGGICTREATCGRFCWQHTKIYGGSIKRSKTLKGSSKCKKPKIDKCVSCKHIHDATFPCLKKKRALFTNESSYKEYCDLKVSRPKGAYSKKERGVYAEFINEENNEKIIKSVKKSKTSKRRVRFQKSK